MESAPQRIEQTGLRGWLHLPAGKPTAALAITHGAGTNCEAPLIVAAARAFAAAGYAALRYDLPFRQANKPPTGAAQQQRDRDGIRQAAAALRQMAPSICLAGHSYGGRQTSMLLAEDYPQYADLETDIQAVHSTYIRYKKEHQLMDYDDLLANLVLLLRQQEPVRAMLSDRFKYIMVDEYQDTNKVQAEIVKLLCFKHQNVMVVGDDAQSIYSFRGSTIKNILEFPREFPESRIIKLEENFRSTQPILNLANEILRRGTVGNENANSKDQK